MWPQLDIKIECIRKNKYVRYIEKIKTGGLLISFLLIDLISHTEKSVNQFESCVAYVKVSEFSLVQTQLKMSEEGEIRKRIVTSSS